MRRLLVAALVAIFALACWSGTATANRSLTNSGGRTIESTDRSFTLVEAGTGVTIRCELFVMGIMMTEAIRKMAGSPAGNIFSSNARNCTESLRQPVRVIPLVEERTLWPMTYNSFAGTLPRITEVLLSWLILILVDREPMPDCLYGGPVGIRTTGTTGPEFYVAERFSPLAGSTIPILTRLREEVMRRCPTGVEVRFSFIGERVRVVMLLT